MKKEKIFSRGLGAPDARLQESQKEIVIPIEITRII